jgi:hypothetical protein
MLVGTAVVFELALDLSRLPSNDDPKET